MQLDELLKFASKNAYFCFASGTLALNFSLLGIPTILLDISFKRISNRKYKFMFEVNDFSLGDTDLDIPILNKPNLLDKLSLSKVDYANAAQLSIDYVKNNHDIYLISKKLIHHLDKCEFTLKCHYSHFFKKPIYYQFYIYIRNLL